LFSLVNIDLFPFLPPRALAAASDPLLPVLTMIFSRADRCISE